MFSCCDMQLLISESSAEKKLDKGNKKEDKKETGSLKNNKAENPSGPNVEMDSRLLSALLTVNYQFPMVLYGIICWFRT